MHSGLLSRDVRRHTGWVVFASLNTATQTPAASQARLSLQPSSTGPTHPQPHLIPALPHCTHEVHMD